MEQSGVQIPFSWQTAFLLYRELEIIEREGVMYWVTLGRAIAHVHGRIQSHNRRKGQTDRPF